MSCADLTKNNLVIIPTETHSSFPSCLYLFHFISFRFVAVFLYRRAWNICTIVARVLKWKKGTCGKSDETLPRRKERKKRDDRNVYILHNRNGYAREREENLICLYLFRWHSYCCFAFSLRMDSKSIYVYIFIHMYRCVYMFICTVCQAGR